MKKSKGSKKGKLFLKRHERPVDITPDFELQGQNELHGKNKSANQVEGKENPPLIVVELGNRIEFEDDERPEPAVKPAGKPMPSSHGQQGFADENTVLIKRTVRSGQSIQFDGNVVVLGDVNPGSEIIATGNIVVMGALRGVVHAGATGNEDATVAAFKLLPTQLRIANHITRAPDGDYITPEHPEIARIKDGVVVIELYQMGQDKQIKIC